MYFLSQARIPEVEPSVLESQPPIPEQEVDGALREEELVAVVVDGLARKVPEGQMQRRLVASGDQPVLYGDSLGDVGSVGSRVRGEERPSKTRLPSAAETDEHEFGAGDGGGALGETAEEVEGVSEAAADDVGRG